jgi:hypothetical protein
VQTMGAQAVLTAVYLLGLGYLLVVRPRRAKMREAL